MKKKLSIFGILLTLLVLEFPIEGFAARGNTLPLSVSPAEGTQVVVAVNQPRRRRRRRVFRNGRWIWIGYAPNRRYRMVRRPYYLGGVRRTRLVRVYY